MQDELQLSSEDGVDRAKCFSWPLFGPLLLHKQVLKMRCEISFWKVRFLRERFFRSCLKMLSENEYEDEDLRIFPQFLRSAFAVIV